jgi:hypothetical protein
MSHIDRLLDLQDLKYWLVEFWNLGKAHDVKIRDGEIICVIYGDHKICCIARGVDDGKRNENP